MYYYVKDLFTVLCFNGSLTGNIDTQIGTEPVQTNLLTKVQNIFNTPGKKLNFFVA